MLLARRNFFQNRDMSRALKVRAYNTVQQPVVTYGNKIWTLTKQKEVVEHMKEKSYAKYMAQQGKEIFSE